MTTFTPTDTGRLGGKELGRIVFSEDEIRDRVRTLGAEIREAHADAPDLLLLGLLKGSFVFLADLVRAIERPLQIDFLVVSSYGAGTVSSGQVELLYDPDASLEGRTAIVVDDIVDSGATVRRLWPRLQAGRPATLELCALLRKRCARVAPEPRWVGFDAPNEFLVGYGLDYAEDFRHLPYIAAL